MHSRRVPASVRVSACLIALLCAPALVLAGPADFTLGKAIPADAFMAVNSRSHEGQAFLKKQGERVWAAIEKARFDKDVKKLLTQAMSRNRDPDADPNEVERIWQQISDLAAGVNWGKLGERETAFGMKLGFPTSEFVVLMQPTAGTIDTDFKGLADIVKAISDLDKTQLALSSETTGDLTRHTLTLAAAPFPMSITLARFRDTILLGMGSSFVEQSLALLSTGKGDALPASPRFQEAFKGLPPPVDELMFVDLAKLMKQTRSMLSEAFGMAARSQPEADPTDLKEIEQIKQAFAKFVDGIDMWEYIASVQATSGMKTDSQTLTVLRDDAKGRLFYPALYGTGTLSDPLKYVPQDAGSFNASTGFNFSAFYQAVVKLVREDVPDGARHVEHWEQMQEDMQLNLDKDVLSWMQGSMIGFDVPGPTQFSTQEFVWMLRVNSESKANDALTRLFDAIAPMLEQQKGVIEPAAIKDVEGFRCIKQPMLAMFGISAPTLGVKDGWLFIASSPKVLDKTFATARGEAPNFGKSERFQKEGIPPAAANLVELSFNDQTKFAEQVGSMMQSIPAMLGIFGGAEIRKNPGMDTMLSVMMKVGGVIKTMDYFQSAASMGTFDGKRLVTKSIQTYREPPVKTPPADANKPAEKKDDSGTKAPDKK